MPLETESTREKSFRTSKTNTDTMKASRNYRSTLRRCAFRYGRDLWLHRCRQHCTWTRVTKRIGNYSRILNLRTSKVCSESREWWLKEIQKLRMYSPQTLRVHSGIGKTARSRRCDKKVEWSSVNFEDVSCLQRIASVGWRADWLRVEDLPRSQSIGYSPQNSSRPTWKEHHTWKLQWSNNLHDNVQWHWTGKDR